MKFSSRVSAGAHPPSRVGAPAAGSARPGWAAGPGPHSDRLPPRMPPQNGAEANPKRLGVPVVCGRAGRAQTPTPPFLQPGLCCCRQARGSGHRGALLRARTRAAVARAEGRTDGRIGCLLSRESKWSDAAIALRRWCLARRRRAALTPATTAPLLPPAGPRHPGPGEPRPGRVGPGGQRGQPAGRIRAGGAGTAGLE